MRAPTESTPNQQGQVLQGKTFVVTGTLETYTRKGIKEAIQSLGGKVAGSVSSRTDFVVVGKNPGSKHTKALELGIEVLSEKDFEAMVGDPAKVSNLAANLGQMEL